MEAVMQVAKWGNSLAVRLPKKLVEEMRLSAGDEVNLTKISNHAIAIEKIEYREAALDRMTQRNWVLPEGYMFNRDEANER
jgi:antitoxin MazE